MSDDQTEGENIQLRDGSQMSIRPVGPEDRALLAAAFEELSFESRHRRFFAAMSELDAEQLSYLTQVDHHDHEALVALDAGSGSAAGVARFARIDEDVAEPAIVVVDRWQRLGLGSILLERLAVRALEEGVGRFRARVLADNQEAIGLFEQLGEVVLRASGPELDLEVILSEPEVLGLRLREFLRAAASGLLAPARAAIARRGTNQP